MLYCRSLWVVLLLGSPVLAGDWPQWLGPRRDGSTEEKVAPWKGPLKELWRQPVGEGHGSPVVADGRVFLLTRGRTNTEEVLAAFDAQTGKPLWNTPYPRGPFNSIFGNGPRATPAVAGQLVFTFGSTAILTCCDATNGTIRWQVNTLKTFKAPGLFFGASCSPLVVDNLVLLNVGGPGAGIVAFDKNDGKTVWQKLDDGASYASPISVGTGSQKQVVFLTHKGLVSLAPATGQVYWQFPFEDDLSESSATPAVVGDLLIGSAITSGTVGLRLTTRKDQPRAKLAWFQPNLTSYFATPVPVGRKQLYLVSGTTPPALFIKATLHCLDADTGKELWQRPKVGKYHASLLRTGDDKLLLLEEEGNLVLLDPNPKEYRELARSRICTTTWAHPAIADGRLFIRDAKHLICVQLNRGTP